MKQKTLSFEVGDFGTLVGALVISGPKMKEVRYRTGEKLPVNTSPVKMEIVPHKAQIYLTIENAEFEDVTTPPIVQGIIADADVGELEIV